MKKLALAATLVAVGTVGASAADLAPRPYVKAPVAASPVYNWTGFYAGIELGAQFTENNWRTTSTFLPPVPPAGGASASFDRTAFRGGGYAGYNYQFSPNWLIGIEGDIAGMAPSKRTLIGIPGTLTIPGQLGANPATTPDRTTAEAGWDASLRGRFGYVASPNVLLYGTGGVAFADARYSAFCGTPGFPIAGWCSVGIPKTETHSSVLVGWTAGAGIEVLVTPNWIIRGEYRYSEYKAQNHVFFANAPADDAVSATTKLRTHNAMLGIAYKFGGPVVARY